ncbi:putative ABC-type ATPase [Methanomicrobium sp. W14]|uniref:AAA family ATPase n=1 Tax=Methanomicrobium sp. W14 TaxID=2817839 RepID=UPI001AE7401C|nr:AAA family ATPase [Methanomicrobium sp. W14]MBP2132370.1 putative ABC-type ATPase [Methanomicrobium sp. W14]
MKDFFLFAGPNGSGKSTIIKPFIDNNSIVYLNADYCARADPVISKMPDGPEKLKKAQAETERLLKEMISEELTFAWETVFSHKSRLGIMEYAKKEGYKIHLTYITTKNPDINVARVHQRVLEGGHDVPEDKIRGRYNRSVAFLPEMVQIADEVLVYDNSYENVDPKLLFQKFIQTEEGVEPEMVVWKTEDTEVNDWVIKYLSGPLMNKGISVKCYKEI